VNRDVFADFGEVDALSCTFSVPDGEAAFVDHVYFARGANDFQYLKVNP
jgi:hypothetical protein